jgi:hypothetical protein
MINFSRVATEMTKAKPVKVPSGVPRINAIDVNTLARG